MKYKPASEYDALLKQFNSLCLLLESKEVQLKSMSIQLEELTKKYALVNQAELESERLTNRMLTNYVEMLENQIESQKLE